MENNSAIYDLIHKEHDRVQKEIDLYGKMKEQLDADSGSVRIVKDRYIYRVYYENGESKAQYIGTIEEVDNQKWLQEMRLKKYYEEMIRSLNKEKKELEDYIRVGKKYHKEKRGKDPEEEYERE